MGGGISAHKDVNAFSGAARVFPKLPKVPQGLKWPVHDPRFQSNEDNEKNLQSWGFNIWVYEPKDLVQLSMLLMTRFELHTKFNLSPVHWYNLMGKVEILMATSINPYHNFRHILDVMHTTSIFIAEMGATSILEDLDILALLIAALVHDLEHPGTNNVYQINAATPLAIRYNDTSVLENHHCATAFEIFNQPDSCIMQALSTEERKNVRKTIISLILSTDMSHHFGLQAELDKVVSKYNDPANIEADGVTRKTALSSNDKLVVMRALLHAADISNPAKIWSVSKKWSDLVVQEFFAQGDREKRENMSVSMNCDRDTTAQDELSINFTDFIVAPFFLLLAKLLPKMFTAVSILESNRNTWHDILMKRLLGTQSIDAGNGNDESILGSKQGSGLVAEGKDALDEAIVKWETRKKAFAEKVRAAEAVIPNPPLQRTLSTISNN